MRYLYDKDSGEILPADQVYAKRAKTARGPIIITDEMPLTPHPCNGKHYSSKKFFRDETRARGCVEVGNEKLPPKQYTQHDSVRPELSRVVNQLWKN